MRPLRKVLVCAAMLAVIAGAASAQDKKFDSAQVRSNFEAASAEHFDYVKSELSGLDSEKRNDLYWLAHVKPKRAGHYAVRYTFKYNDRFYSEGDFKISVRVGKKNCDRQSSGKGISRFCLGDTVILPIRAANRYDYEFSVKFAPDGDPEIEKPPTYGTLPDPPAVDNPLAAKIKYIGTTRGERFHRNRGSTISYSAVFKAVAPGRFNIVLSRRSDGSDQVKPAEGTGVPVLIVGPDESITALAMHEDTINYADDRKFMSTSGGTFPTDLLIVRPGDTFALPFSSTVTGRPGKYLLGVDEGASLRSIPVPDIQSVKFYIDPNAGFNQFIAEFFNTK